MKKMGIIIIIKLLFSAILVLHSTLFLQSTAEPIEDKQALLDFIANVSHTRNLNWDSRLSVCSNWTGVTCNHDNSRVIAVRLPAIGFRGRIPTNTLSRLSELQILSLRSNGLNGPFPSDLLKLGNLIGLHLQFNAFQGPLPLDFPVWENLSVLNLSNNGFDGNIPFSISNLTHLTALDLSNNSLSGNIPEFNIPTLQLLDLSNNNLTGFVPQSLSRFPSYAFLGNNVSFLNSSSPVLSPIPKKHSSKFTKPAILGIVIGSSVLAFVAIALLLIFTNRSRKEDNSMSPTSKNKKKEKSTKRMASEDRNGRITFFEGCNLVFDLEDLLRASAEVLGKGTFGTTYKAALEDATTVAVKRLKDVIAGKREFEQQMEIVGNIRHENVAPLRAYYYSKDEKLMVYDYYNQGSVSSMLHAKRGENTNTLDWETRLRIAIGAAKGIDFIHSQNGGKLVHANIKASNIFINPQNYGCLSDLGLATLTCPVSPPLMRTAGYRAPEVTDTRKVSQASDVYSFGVFLLELLTGKSPVQATGGEEVVHLVRWVHSVVREEWTGEVFDVELLRYPNIEEEMVAMLQIGLSCVARMPEQRPKIGDVVKMVEGIRNVVTGNTNNSPTISHGSTPSAAEIASSSVS